MRSLAGQERGDKRRAGRMEINERREVSARSRERQTLQIGNLFLILIVRLSPRSFAPTSNCVSLRTRRPFTWPTSWETRSLGPDANEQVSRAASHFSRRPANGQSAIANMFALVVKLTALSGRGAGKSRRRPNRIGIARARERASERTSERVSHRIGQSSGPLLNIINQTTTITSAGHSVRAPACESNKRRHAGPL